jgi:hypothetical protein
VDRTGSGLCPLMFTGVGNVAHLGHATTIKIEFQSTEDVIIII